MYQDFHYNLKKEIDDINMDILALLAEDDDMLDEIKTFSKRRRGSL
jgi:hypothetical protein